MKISKSKLRQLIKEELENVLLEAPDQSDIVENRFRSLFRINQETFQMVQKLTRSVEEISNHLMGAE